jgi:hypothetical protein
MKQEKDSQHSQKQTETEKSKPGQRTSPSQEKVSIELLSRLSGLPVEVISVKPGSARIWLSPTPKQGSTPENKSD